MGAWIETSKLLLLLSYVIVAPRVGAWIETSKLLLLLSYVMSHPVWVRGLKPKRWDLIYIYSTSHPVWVRGLKHTVPIKERTTSVSRTPWGCVDVNYQIRWGGGG